MCNDSYTFNLQVEFGNGIVTVWSQRYQLPEKKLATAVPLERSAWHLNAFTADPATP